MTPRSLHPSLLAVLALFLSGCASVFGVTAFGPGVPLRADIHANADVQTQVEVDATAQANATAQADATARANATAQRGTVEVNVTQTGGANAQVETEATGQVDVQVAAGGGGVWADDRDAIAGWQGSARTGAPPDPFDVGDASAEVQVASVGGASVGASGAASGGATSSRDGDAHSNANGQGVVAAVDAQGTQQTAGGLDPFAGADGHVDAQARLDASVQADADARVPAQAEAEARAHARHLGGGAGVRGLEGHAPHVTALIRGGLNVDGELTDLTELAPLWVDANAGADVGASVEARIDTGAELVSSVSLEHSRLPAVGGETHLVVRVRGADLATGSGSAQASARGHVRVRLVIDRSSSMQASWRQVLGAARDLLARLSPDDELQIVAYGTRAVEALPTSRVGDGSRARRALADIRVGGGTNIEAGLRLAYDAGAHDADDRLTLVVLVSDGVPNGGAFTADELAPMAARAKLEQGCRTTVVGFGDEFDAEALRAIAQAGGGAYRVAPGAEELAAVLESEVSAMGQVRARDVRVRVALPAGVHLSEAAGDAHLTANHEVELTVPALGAGEERSLILGVRVDAGRGSSPVARVSVSYRVGATQRQADKSVSVVRGAVRFDADAARALADADLGLALDIAARAVNNGDAAEAAAALRAHATRMNASVDVRVRARAGAAGRVASALEHLVPGASWPERRRTSLAIGELNARFGG